MTLTIPQQCELQRLAAAGGLLFDCLLCIGILPAQTEELCKDREVRALHRQGRAEGARKIRAILMREAENGNISAVRALSIHKDYEEPEEEQTRRAATQPVKVDVVGSVNALFERMRKLHESPEMEVESVELGKKESDNG
jgi:hypothetical protein